MLLFAQNAFALQCAEESDTLEERVKSASEIFVAVIVSAEADINSNPMKLSARYVLVESLKGSPAKQAKLISQLTMDGIIFAPGRRYLLFLHGNNYVGFCGGSSRLDSYQAPYENEDDERIEKIRSLVRGNT